MIFYETNKFLRAFLQTLYRFHVDFRVFWVRNISISSNVFLPTLFIFAATLVNAHISQLIQFAEQFPSCVARIIHHANSWNAVSFVWFVVGPMVCQAIRRSFACMVFLLHRPGREGTRWSRMHRSEAFKTLGYDSRGHSMESGCSSPTSPPSSFTHPPCRPFQHATHCSRCLVIDSRQDRRDD